MKKEFRVLKNYEFSSIIQNRQFVKSSSFVCYFQKRKLDHARVGISVGKKLGNAVCRNKVKRQIRSIVDDIFTFEEGYDLIIIVRPAYANKSFEENKNEMKENQNRINKRFFLYYSKYVNPNQLFLIDCTKEEIPEQFVNQPGGDS